MDRFRKTAKYLLEGVAGVALIAGATAANANYTGGVSDTRSTSAVGIGGMATLDLTGHYRVDAPAPLGGLALRLSAQDLLNAKPSPIATVLPDDAPYDSTNYSPVGRMIAVGISRKW